VTAPRESVGEDARPGDWLVGGGEMGKLVRSMDWSQTPLGPIASWPQSLRTTVSLCLASNFPISLAWGPKHVQIYNDGYWPICGGKHPDSMGQDFSECWASAWPAIGDAFETALAGESAYLENQRMYLDRHGYLEETFFTFSFSPIRDETGGVGGLFHPVTETTTKMVGERRTRALRDLVARAGQGQTSEEVFALAAQTLFEFGLDVPFAVFYLLDARGQGAQLIAQTGPLPEAIARPTVDFNAPQDPAWPLKEVARSRQAQQVDGLKARFGTFSCGPYPETLKSALVLPITPPGAESPTAILVAGVSSRLPLNETYRAFYDLVAAAVTSAVANARAYEEERKRAEALAEIDRAKTAFFSNVSHEFRTPLTLMLGPLEDELAERASPLPPERRDRLETAHRNTLRLLKLVNALLDFSRIEAGRIQASYEMTDLAVYTGELASVFRSAVEKAGLTLTVDCPSLPEPFYVDRDMWEKIVLNLLSNAFKHTFEGGIRVTLRWCNDHAELAVADSGVGIPEAELPHLFDRFHRVKGAKARTYEGTGIGLALVQELARVHGGTVRVESREGKGSTFTVDVMPGYAHPAAEGNRARSEASTATRAAPFVEEALHWVSDAAAPPAPPAETPGHSHRGGRAGASSARPRILWAEDNADMRDYVRRLLVDRYDVTAVRDGATALAAAFVERPDLVLTDVMMPGLDGFGLLRELRADERTRTIPVILLSARAGEESALEGLEAGADDYLVKPFSARELLARVRTHLDLASLRCQWALELEAANKELEAFSYSVSHDLRAPLRSVQGFSMILLEKFSPEIPAEARGLLERVIGGAKLMDQLIEDLLRLSRLGQQALSKHPVDLRALVQDVLQELRREQDRREVTVEVGDLPACIGDRALLRQVFVNLLSNAFKFTRHKDKPTVQVGCREHDGETVYFVRDNGAGFQMRYAGKLFGVFQRLHTREQFEGTGVGLTIVDRIIRRHGGRIWAEAEVDKGAVFYFTL
jgi:signal transduction histidine kinase